LELRADGATADAATADAAAPLPSAAARPGAASIGALVRTALAGLVAGCVAAAVLLGAALSTEFPLFSEASAERGRDCTAIASARHALDAELQAHLPAPSLDAETARGIRSAVAAFEARTQDLATPSVVGALVPVRTQLDRLSDTVAASVGAPAAASAATSAGETVTDAYAAAREAWGGAIARVCG
jgi:hypothetical protein